MADSYASLGRVIPLAVTSCPAPINASKIPRAAIKVVSREPLTADQRPRQAHVVLPKPHPSAASEGCCTRSPVSRTPAPQCVGSAIANKAVAEKKIIATGERNDGVHEINAGAAPRLPVDWNRRHGQPHARPRLVAICHGKKPLLMLFAIIDVPSTLRPFQRCVHTSYRPRQYLSPTKLTPFRLA